MVEKGTVSAHPIPIESTSSFFFRGAQNDPVYPKFCGEPRSKTVISFVVMRLFDRGLLALDADVNTYLANEFALRNPAFPKAPVTLRQLLSHTSSIDDDQYSSRGVYDHILVQGDSSISRMLNTRGSRSSMIFKNYK